MIQVLYLDDEEDLLDIGKTFLEFSGDLEVDISLTVKDAMARLEKNKYDAIISDYQMPFMSGIEFLKKLRSQGNWIPFILFTGKGREEVVIDALNEGADFYLQKGGKPEAQFKELEHKIKKAVSKRRTDVERAASIELLKLINSSKGKKDLITSILAFFAQRTGCDACGVRLRHGDDYPYYESIGFSHDQITEKPLCDRKASILDGTDGNDRSLPRCMCGNIIAGRFDPDLPFFTEAGSFWTDSISDLSSKAISEWPIRSGNKCISQGYESIALIPLRFGNECLGLLQIDFKKKGMLDLEMVLNLERLAGNQAVALAKLRSEEALSESEQKFSKAFYASANPKSLSRMSDGRFVEVNDRFLKTLGWTKEETVGNTAIQMRIWDDLKVREEVINGIKTQGYVYDKEVKLRRKDGTVLDILYSGQVLFLGGEEILQSSFIDMTERKKAEEMLRRDDRRNRALFELTQMTDPLPEDIAEKAMNLCIEISSSKMGYIAFLNEDETIVSMQHFSAEAMKECEIENKSMVTTMENTGLWTEAVRKRVPVITNDYAMPSPMKKGLPEGHVALTRHMSIPVFDGGRIVAVTGVGNKDTDYTEQDSIDLTLLMNDMWRIIRKIEAEKAMRESKEAYLKLINSNPDIIVQTDMSGNIVLVNTRALVMGGYSDEDVIGKNISAFIAHEDTARARASIEKVISGLHEPASYRLLTKDGKALSIESNGEVLRDDDGMPIGLLFVGRDMTDREKAENDLAKSEAKFRSFIEASADGVCLTDTDGRFIEWNSSMARITGVSREEAIGQYSWVVQNKYRLERTGADDDGEGLKKATLEALRTGQASFFNRNVTIDIQGKGGSVRRLEQTAFPMKTLEGYRIGIITRDVTDAREAEKSVNESEKKFRSIFNSTNDSIYIHDKHGRFLEVNEIFCMRMGYTSEELLKMKLGQIYPSSFKDTLNEKKVEIVEKGAVIFEGVHVTKDGRRISVEISAKTVDYQGNDAYLSIARDITERKKAEEALTQANRKMNLLTQVTRHDMANQLVLLNGYVELIKKAKDNSDLMMWQKKMEKTLESLGRQLEFTKQYQDIGVKEPVWQNLHELVVRSRSHLSLGGLRLKEEGTDVQILADPLFEKVVLNLIDNAVRHSQAKHLIIKAVREEDELVISFKDDGIGIGDEDRKHIFERGYGKNTGFGLFMSREILGMTHGEIKETSAAGEGANFEIIIPMGYFCEGKRAA